MGPTNQPAVIKAAARRAFGDVSNVAKPVVASKGQKENATEKPGKVVLHPKEQIAVRDAISKPAQRNAIRAASATATSTLAKQPMGGPPRRVVKKTAVYEDKRPSPPKAKSRSPRGRVSPRGKNGAIIRRESRQIGPIQPAAKTAPVAQAPALKKTKSDIPTFSDQPSQTYLRGETASVAVTEEEYDEDATDVEDFRTPTAAITDDEEYDYDEEEDEEEYSSARSRPAGDNTTTNVTQTVHLLPKYTAEDKKKLTAASKEYSGIDEDDMWDITMVAEYGDDIFEYMKELEVCLASSKLFIIFTLG